MQLTLLYGAPHALQLVLNSSLVFLSQALLSCDENRGACDHGHGAQIRVSYCEMIWMSASSHDDDQP